MTGIFDLSTPQGLREKLRRDLERLKAEPWNVDAAFNFFVTAEHMLDWVYPKNANRQKRAEAKKQTPLLRVCSHLANGAKHFEVEGKQHDSIASTGISAGYIPRAYVGAYVSRAYVGGGALFVTLKGNAAKELGQIITVIQLAEKVIDHWNNHPLA